jgi:outer membrane protein assembly factor BamB
MGLAPPVAGVAAASTDDPWVGKWQGTAGSERERVAVGIELRRHAEGGLAVRLTQPISNYFDAEFPGAFRVEGDRLQVEGLALDLRLRDGRLEGFYPGPNSPVVLERVGELPQPVPIPSVPAGPLASWRPKWQTRLNGQVFATPAVHEGIAYVGTTGGVLDAVRVEDGERLWTFSAGRPMFGDALVAGDAIFFACDNGYLFKLERAAGKELWRYDLGDARVSRILGHPTVFDWDWQGPRPVIADGVVFVGSGDGGFHAVDAATGARRWRFEGGERIRNGAAIDGEHVIFGSGGLVFALDRATGREVWRRDVVAPVDATPVVAGDRVFVGNRGGGLYALSSADGAELWRLYFWGSWVESTPVVVDGVLYIGSSDLRRVSAIDPVNGRVLWRSDVYGWTWGTPTIDGDRLYAGVAGGTPYFVPHVASLTALDRSTGAMLWRYPLPEVGGAHQWGIAGSPVVVGRTLVVATLDGSLYGFPLTGS